MDTNVSMTLFHKVIINHEEVWQKIYIDGVMWQEKTSVNQNTGYSDVSEVNVYVPYLICNIKNEDVIVAGGTNATKPSEIKRKYYTVTSVDLCNYGSEEMQHTEIVGK